MLNKFCKIGGTIGNIMNPIHPVRLVEYLKVISAKAKKLNREKTGLLKTFPSPYSTDSPLFAKKVGKFNSTNHCTTESLNHTFPYHIFCGRKFQYTFTVLLQILLLQVFVVPDANAQALQVKWKSGFSGEIFSRGKETTYPYQIAILKDETSHDVRNNLEERKNGSIVNTKVWNWTSSNDPPVIDKSHFSAYPEFTGLDKIFDLSSNFTLTTNLK